VPSAATRTVTSQRDISTGLKTPEFHWPVFPGLMGLTCNTGDRPNFFGENYLMNLRFVLSLGMACFVPCLSTTEAAGWPAYRHDSQRTATTAEQLKFPLRSHWAFQPGAGPRRAWPRPFRDNPFSGVKVRALLTFDHAFQPVSVNGRVYFGSSSDHKVYCLDAASGEVKWTFFTEGPVRMAPTVHRGNVYVGGDDGRVYCLEASSGREVWRYQVGPGADRLPGNEQMISRWPIRSGVIVENDTVYAAAGLFPAREGAYLCALKAGTGQQRWKEKVDQTTQGYLLITPTRLFVPSGKLRPGMYDPATGKHLGKTATPRGSFASIVDDLFVAGPSLSGGKIDALVMGEHPYRLGKFDADQVIVTSRALYLLNQGKLKATSRAPLQAKRLERRRDERVAEKKKATEVARQAELDQEIEELNRRIAEFAAAEKNFNSWTQACSGSYAMVMAGETLIVGGEDNVAAFRANTGEKVWTAEVEGKAHGLAVADGRLFVSTDRGLIHCFGSGSGVKEKRIRVDRAESQKVAALLARPYSQVAERIIQEAGEDQGYCLLVGSSGGQLAAELARRGHWRIVVVETDPRKVKVSRENLDKAGLYGERVVVHHLVGGELPYPNLLFNLIVSEQAGRSGIGPTAEELYRVLRPYGVAMVGALPGGTEQGKGTVEGWLRDSEFRGGKVDRKDGGVWAVIRRDELSGSGRWDHQYAGPGNTACSEDTVVSRDVRLQWYGEPGPYRMFDRHSYTAAPVYSHGRLFTLGERIAYGSDAYNGVLLWATELPELEPRVNVPRDCGFMAASEDYLYLAAGDKCLRLETRSGKRTKPYELPSLEGEASYRWGYVAIDDRFLFGSAVRAGSFYSKGRGPWYDDSGFGKPSDSLKVLSDAFFVMDRATGKLVWKHQGVVINSTIAIGGGRVYFVENRHPAVLANPSRRLAGGKEWMQLHLVALDVKTGKQLWEESLQFNDRTPVFFACYKDEVVTLLRSGKEFDLRALNARSGKRLWMKTHKWEANHHGGHRRHPVLMGNAVYQQPNAYDIKTGEVLWSTKRGKIGGNCGTLSASGSMLFSRLGNHPGFVDLGANAAQSDLVKEDLVQVTRPGCWINIIPAGGMILVPEAGSGCSCGFSIHASMAFGPK